MNLSYNRDNDILMLEVSDEPIDYVQQVGPKIVRFTKDDMPVLLEVLDASELLAQITKVTMKTEKEELVKLAM